MRRSILVLLALSVLILPALIATPVVAAVYTVNQTGLTFDPAEITVKQGDTVHWVWTIGIHSVTSGSSPSDPNAGQLFNAPLDTGNRTFDFRFDNTGTFPYYCIYHYGLGMYGMIIVK